MTHTHPTGHRETRDGHDVVVLRRRFPALVDDVWAAVTEPDRLERWMRETDDPLLHGDVEPPPGAEVTDPDAISPADTPIAHR